MFLLDTVVGRVRVAFTDRHCDLAVAAGVDRVAAAFGAQPRNVVVMRQVHGRRVAVVDADSAPADAPTADALVTATPGLVLLARAADCVPVAIADPVRGLAGVVHSSRLGTQAGVVPATVEVLRAQGAGRLRAWIGPRVCGACYEVPVAMRDDVAAVVPATWSTTRAGTPGLDLGAGVRDQLERAGVAVHDLADDRAACTVESDDLFSHRRQGTGAGRLGVLAQVRP